MNTSLSFLMMSDGRIRQSPRSEVSEQVVARVRNKLLHQWPPPPGETLVRTVLKDTSRYGLIIRPVGNENNALVHLVEREDEKITKLVAFGVCWSEEHADEIWSMLKQVHLRALPLPKQPTVPWISTHLWPTPTIDDPGLLSWSAELQLSVAWAISPAASEHVDTAPSQQRTRKKRNAGKKTDAYPRCETLLTKIAEYDSEEGRVQIAKQRLKDTHFNADDVLTGLDPLLSRWIRNGGDPDLADEHLYQIVEGNLHVLNAILEEKDNRARTKAAQIPNRYITHLTLTTGHTRESPRSEVDDEFLATFRKRLLNQWPPRSGHTMVRSLAPYMPKYSIRMRKLPDRHNAVIEILSKRNKNRTFVSFGVCWSEQHAEKIWSLLEELEGSQGAIGSIPERPKAPWIAVVPHVRQLLRDPKPLQWAGDFERVIAWAIAPLQS